VFFRKHFWDPTSTQFPVIKSIRDYFVQNRSRNTWTLLEKFIESQTTIFTGKLFDFLDEIVGHQRRPAAPLLIVHTLSSFSKFSYPFCDVLAIHNIWSICLDKSTMNFSGNDSFLSEKMDHNSHFIEYSVIEVAVARDDSPIVKTSHGQRT